MVFVSNAGKYQCIAHYKIINMALQQLIKRLIFLVIAIVIFSVLKKQPFFQSEPNKPTPSPSADHLSDPKAVLLQNEQIKSQLHHLNSRPPAHYIAGCMKTPSGCQCYDAKAKVVQVSLNVCLRNVKDASSNQHKAFIAKNS